MQYKIIFIFALSLVLSCTTQTVQPDQPIVPSDDLSQIEINDSLEREANQQKAKIGKLETDSLNYKMVTYENCAVYAGATDYSFLDVKTGERILVRVSNFPEEKGGKQPIVPDFLIDRSEDIEGSPGANPIWVGGYFILAYDKNQETVIEVIPK